MNLPKKFSVITVTDDKGDEFIKQQKFPTNREMVKLSGNWVSQWNIALEDKSFLNITGSVSFCLVLKVII